MTAFFDSIRSGSALALIFIVAGLTLGPAWGVSAAQSLGPVTKLPLPRFVNLKRAEVNMRRGPGDDHPIVWKYVRKNLPVEIVNEFDVWRKVRDVDGAEGWISANMLSGDRRYGLVRVKSAKGVATSKGAPGWAIMRRPDAKGEAVAIAQAGVIAEIRRCPAADAWCEIKAGGRKGWIERAALWGVYPGEVIK
jgi:SH3-like domain-containing protein